PQLASGVQAATFTAQPFAVKKATPSELESQTRTGELRDRLSVEGLGGLSLGEQRSHSRFDSECPRGADHAGAFGQPIQRGLEQRVVTGPGCRLSEFRHEPRSVTDRGALERVASG